MKRAFLLTLLLFWPFGLLADDAVEAIQYTYQNLTDLQAQFTQETVLAAMGKTVANRGTLALKKPGRLRLDYEGNPQRRYISDGKHLWVATPGDLQYQVYPVGGKAVPREALAFLNGFGQLTKLFHVEPFAPQKPQVHHTYLRLRPRAPAGYRHLDCAFDGRHLLIDLTIINLSGNQTRYRFQNVRVNPGLGEAFFRFVPPPGARAVQEK